VRARLQPIGTAERLFPCTCPRWRESLFPGSAPLTTGHAYSPARVTNPNPTNSTPTSNASVSRRPSRNIYPRRTRANHRPPYCPRAFCAARLPERRTPDTPVTTTPFALPPPPASQPASQPALCALGFVGRDRRPSTTLGVSASPSLCAHPG
jgi:hypothetical protein